MNKTKMISSIVIIILVSTILVFTRNILLNPPQSIAINNGDIVRIDQKDFTFSINAERVWGAGYGGVQIRFSFSSASSSDNLSMSLIIAIITNPNNTLFQFEQSNEINRIRDTNHLYLLIAYEGPFWECNMKISLDAEIKNLLNNKFYIIENEELVIFCWG